MFIKGTGFSIRDRTLGDVDDELDIEGEDEDTFGAAQFNEGDLLPPDSNEDEMVDIDDASADEDSSTEEPSVEDSSMRVSSIGQVSRARTLRDLVSTGEVVRRPLVNGGESKAINLLNDVSTPLDGIADLEQEILNVEMKDDKDALIAILRRKVALLVGLTHSLLNCRSCFNRRFRKPRLVPKILLSLNLSVVAAPGCRTVESAWSRIPNQPCPLRAGMFFVRYVGYSV